MIIGWSVVWLACACASSAAAEKWRFPETASSIRIDTKVGFVDRDNDDQKNYGNVQSDEPAFEPAIDTSGFYNRPVGAPGRFPVRVESHDYRAPYKVDGQGIYSLNSVHKTPQSLSNDGSGETLKYCKCVSTPECNPSVDSAKACGSGKFLCCYKRPNKHQQLQTEFFNELDDERPELHPGQSVLNGPFPPPPGPPANNYFGPQQRPGNGNQPIRQQPALLVGPDGPTGNIGPPKKPIYPNVNQPNNAPANPAVLVGPDGPTGIIGPSRRPNELGPAPANPAVLVGPDGPTGIIGPSRRPNQLGPPQDLGSDETAQRGILVGPGGPTGIIGPGYNRRQVLVGPGGPTGIIGPFGYGRNQMRNPGILVGPGGPTGNIGPSRGVLVGPGGPTGQIGPRNPFYFGK